MDNGQALKEAKYHAWFHHQGSDGWVTLAKKTSNGNFKQYHYKPVDLALKLSDWLGEDVYFSQNTFYKPQRRIENIRQLKALYVDLDFYLFNYAPSWVLGKLEHEYFGKVLPEPNIIIFSGQGMVLIWLIEPVPSMALPLWQAVQNHFLGLLSDLGGDSKASDAARIFRIAGSINSKNGAEVRADYLHEHRYELRQLQHDYLPELDEAVKPSKQKRKGRKKKVVQLFNLYGLNYKRFMDLVKIVELRNYEIDGYRELICFLYRYWLCCYTDDPQEALNQTMTFNLQFTNPLSVNEVEKATRSAEKAWLAKNNEEANRLALEKGYPGAGYNLSNKKIISWLEITPEEMTHLATIIDASEKKRRKRIANMEQRREQGVRPRAVYRKEQHSITDNHLFNLQQALEQNPKAKRKDLAELLGLSISSIDKLKAKLKKL